METNTLENGKKIKRYELNEVNEGFRVYPTPRGCLELQLKETNKKITKSTEKIVKRPVSQKETYVAAATTILKLYSLSFFPAHSRGNNVVL